MQAQIPEVALGFRRNGEPLPSYNRGITVYRGEGIFDGRRAALKFYDLSLHGDGRFEQTLRNEIRAYSSLNFQRARHIVPYITSGQVSEGGSEFAVVVTEFMSGGSLEDKLEQTPLPMPRVMEISIGIAKGLIELHENKPTAYHLDLKPSNVLFDEYGVVRLADFGTAKIKSEHPTGSMEGPYGSFSHLGHRDFRSPEQKDQKKTHEANHRTDIFQLSKIMYLMIGEQPYTEEGTKPREINPDVSEELERIILKAHATDPTRRYQSAREVLYDLVMIGAKPNLDQYEERIRALLNAHNDAPLTRAELRELKQAFEQLSGYVSGIDLPIPYSIDDAVKAAQKRFETDDRLTIKFHESIKGSPHHLSVMEQLVAYRDSAMTRDDLRQQLIGEQDA